NISKWLPNIPSTLQRIGNYSLSVLGTFLLLILFFTMIIYGVSNPKPLAHLYFTFFPINQREKAREALMNTSIMLAGWMRSNFVAGTIRAICVTLFLSLMKVPGAYIWGTLAFFSDLIPRIGFYIMAIPSLIAALSVNTTVALWVLVFFLALDEIMGDFIIPRLRAKSMNLHPVSTLFILLAMGSAFGLMGLLMATPVAAIIKAYYEAFHLKDLPDDENLEHHVNSIIHRVN
ncbi:MAG TPA: AI-2E family transporter, partial [Flavitalea sp.]|nr:AI-2E family transporter [Flavitalea sp.]